jgi:hypothetical protein
MRLFRVDNWLKTHPDRDIIARWTLGVAKDKADAAPAGYTLEMPPPEDPDNWEFLALGDTGDSDAAGPGLSPQEAVARQMAGDAILPESNGQGRGQMVIHTGDVIYMTGEKRLYDRNFRRPYAPFLTPESTIDTLTFRVPFLPVPGNHDYYDLGTWGRWLGRVPLLGSGLRAIAHNLFAFSLPEGGSDMGRAYMEAFVDLAGGGLTRTGEPLPYRPGAQTRIPNRYYQFRHGNVDCFALDSNTLDAPPPGTDIGRVRQDAAAHIAVLEERARQIDAELRHEQAARDRWSADQRRLAASDPGRRPLLTERVAQITTYLGTLRALLEEASAADSQVTDAIRRAERRWQEGASDLAAPEPTTETIESALRELDDASDDACAALRDVEATLSELPEGPLRARLLGARDQVETAQSAWADFVTPPSEEIDDRLRKLSEDALDVQRELVLEKRRLRYRPEDHDAGQLRWLDAALARSERERPDAWRIVFLHHPLYTTIVNHCERPDVQNLRDNLLALLKGRVHLVLSGHSHAFEWFRSDALPGVGLFVTGGGGQITLRPSLLEPRLLSRRRERYEALRKAGVAECALAGYGPGAADGEDGSVYHYLRVIVSPDTLRVIPVGVRRLRSGAFRREEPMPVFHAPRLPETRPPWRPRALHSVEVRRDGKITANWA